ncbi:Gfo/Idh/MocA family oxidoreductase [Arthrobacter sp. SLBN-112]|uniref:Gfo/Idh/MocA family protein n=1 Tax=Arthrobacter sp. SLBN-112 TaxID=2768452 RepID=UPI0027B4D0FF|nr:Gfo/Idh/MocA family oxidoreductase [Arthrobacter sp. SLBN-112]MDQ0801473.1 1,5-anhydro-D-fructose reductase (1,5-anhydro-D-mannitol-forming) [Arthrobacter sp. SLBN-112]
MNRVKPLVWALIGASDIAATRMVPAIRRVGDSIASVISADKSHAETYAIRNGILRHHWDLQTALDDPAVDAVYISSRNDQHYFQTLSSLAAGKHVLCEKPVATVLSDALEMQAAAEASGLVLAVNHHLPAAGTHRKIREMVTAGSIGKPLSINVRHSTLLPERLRSWRLSNSPGAGVVMDLSCHNASVVNPLLEGQVPLDVVASAVSHGPWGTSDIEDACSSSIHYEGEVLVDFQDSFTMPFTPSYLRINGEAGSILGHDVMTPEPLGTVVLSDSTGTREVPVSDRRHTYDITLLRFHEAVQEGARPIVDGVDAANNLAICLSILEAASSGKRQPVNHVRR